MTETDSITTEQLRLWDKRHVWHPFTQMQEWERDEQIIIVKGEGCWLIASDAAASALIVRRPKFGGQSMRTKS